MVIQDWVMMFASVVFLFSLLPMVIRGPQPPLATSIPTTLGLLSIGIALLTLNLYLSGIMTLITMMLWLMSVVRRVTENEHDEAELG